MFGNELCYFDAVQLRDLIRTKKVSAQEVLNAFLDQIDRFNPQVNAICTLVVDMAVEQARAADDKISTGEPLGLLHGLPTAIKDLNDTKGIRTTHGSLLYENNVPKSDALLVSRIKEAGGVVIGKTNVPEFGAGSHTFNEIFGVTRNPHDLTKSAGGSSGGAAAALAARMLPIADGSDMGGSLRNPGAFCGVVGFRPSPGRVPTHPKNTPWETLGVMGPMGRTVQDVALLLAAISGPSPYDPVSLDTPGDHFLDPLDFDCKDIRIAWTPDLGRLQMDEDIVHVCEQAVNTLETMGCKIEHAAPDLTDAEEIFLTVRSALTAARMPEDLDAMQGKIKDTVIWNAKLAYEHRGVDVGRALVKWGHYYRRILSFMENYDFLVLPTTQVPPFSVEEPWVKEINGVEMPNYISWMESCWAITLTNLPAISVPCGFTPAGLPVGLQIVGGFRKDFDVLRLAHAFEDVTRYVDMLPSLLSEAAPS
ncbi:MAG: amidase [Pseudomonadota bacterium]